MPSESIRLFGQFCCGIINQLRNSAKMMNLQMSIRASDNGRHRITYDIILLSTRAERNFFFCSYSSYCCLVVMHHDIAEPIRAENITFNHHTLDILTV
jgi:hypothetical protein